MFTIRNPRRTTRRGACRFRQRKGAILVLSVFLMVFLVGMLAFSVDLGYVMNVESELKRATDAAALAGAGSLVDGADTAELQAFEFFARNSVGGRSLVEGEDVSGQLEQLLADHSDEFQVQMGHWDPNVKVFTESGTLPSAIRVVTARNDASLFFGRVFGRDSFDATAESIARYLPRDIVLVLDFSASMSDDSKLRRITEMGQTVRDEVESSIAQIYEDLGSPVYGSLQYEPQYYTAYSNNQIKTHFGLRYQQGYTWVDLPYPYPSGSWDDYIDYVKSNNYVNNAGYRNKYGYLTLIDYWQERKPLNSQTPDLWKGSAQPIKAVKDAVDVFVDYIQAVDCEDRMGLVIYSSPAPAQDAVLEHGLTFDFDDIQDTVEHRQAGHYDMYTNIGAGIRKAREELQSSSRIGAFKMIVLMTDGQANKPNNTSYARTYALNQAQLAADEGFPIITISLGNAADTDLMQQVADISGGAHFNLPGGEDIVDFEEDLMDVFRRIADDRPLVLVK